MDSLGLDSLMEDGKINIYPKKNTIDLKNQFGKKIAKIEKKTEKALFHIAREMAKQSKNQQWPKRLWFHCLFVILTYSLNKFIRDLENDNQK